MILFLTYKSLTELHKAICNHIANLVLTQSPSLSKHCVDINMLSYNIHTYFNNEDDKVLLKEYNVVIELTVN